MAKAKSRKGSAGMAQNHLRARISYLNKAASVLQGTVASTPAATVSTESSPDLHHNSQRRSQVVGRTGASNIARQYASQARAVSLKTQMRIPRDTKRATCKRCDARLVPGTSCTEGIENNSRGGKKPWADVRVVKCGTCGTVKRFPQGKERSVKLEERRKYTTKAPNEDGKTPET